VVSVFNNLDADETLLLGYDVKFVPHWNIFHQFVNFIKKIFHIPITQKDMLLGVYYILKTSDSGVKRLIQKSIQTTFRKYVLNGDVEIASKLSVYPQVFEQFINFFHILNKNYFVKAFDYLAYKKLPAPSNLPTLKNTDKSKLTLL
jgi:hypothetical protein